MHLTTLAAPRAYRAPRTPGWHRLIGAALIARPSLLAAAIALVSAAYLVGTGPGDTFTLAWIAGTA